MKYFLIILLSITFNYAFSQCTVTANNNSYQVNITIYPVALSNVVNTGGDCTFRAEMFYNIQFVGTNPPANMFTLQGRVFCAGQNRFFNLPNNGGSGVVTSANGSAPYINGNCSAYNATSCEQTTIIIQGPNIPYQEIICSMGSPLPVELISFEGEQKDDAVLLSFATASEKDNDYFTIEKSTDGFEWNVLDETPGNGTTDKLSQYTVLDRNPNADKIYYRLIQTDFDGTSTIYKIISVQYNGVSNANYSMYPNPTVDQKFNVVYETSSTAPVECRVYDLMGKVLVSYEFKNSNQLEQVTLPNSQSTYIVELVQSGNVIARERIVSR